MCDPKKNDFVLASEIGFETHFYLIRLKININECQK